jgi:uncharacterized membrane protein YeaQ/YmgE (transglycosylase-associated protein family)
LHNFATAAQLAYQTCLHPHAVSLEARAEHAGNAATYATAHDGVPARLRSDSMLLGAVTLTFSNLVLQILVGAIAAGITGRAMRGTGFGILGDLLFGVIGAIGANFVVSYFGLFNSSQSGLVGELIIAAVGAILLVVVTRVFTGRRSTSAAL